MGKTFHIRDMTIEAIQTAPKFLLFESRSGCCNSENLCHTWRPHVVSNGERTGARHPPLAVEEDVLACCLAAKNKVKNLPQKPRDVILSAIDHVQRKIFHPGFPIEEVIDDRRRTVYNASDAIIFECLSGFGYLTSPDKQIIENLRAVGVAVCEETSSALSFGEKKVKVWFWPVACSREPCWIVTKIVSAHGTVIFNFVASLHISPGFRRCFAVTFTCRPVVTCKQFTPMMEGRRSPVSQEKIVESEYLPGGWR